MGNGVFASQKGVEERFRELYGNLRDYKQLSQFDLDGKNLILAYWLEDNSPLQLSVDIFRIEDDSMAKPIKKLFSGSVAEEVEAVFGFDATGDGQKEIVFVSKSGMIKIIRVLQIKDGSLTEIFQNGGSDITVLDSRKEIWIKSRSAREVDIYRWVKRTQKFERDKTLSILY